MGRHRVCFVDELPPGERKIVEVEGRSIGVFNVAGRLYALRNRCPHKGAPLCLGLLKGLVVAPEPYRYEIERDGEILRCPWHGWEFDVATGASVVNPHRLRVKRYDVTVDAEGAAAANGEAAAVDEDPAIETYPVSVDRDAVILHL